MVRKGHVPKMDTLLSPFPYMAPGKKKPRFSDPPGTLSKLSVGLQEVEGVQQYKLYGTATAHRTP